MKKRFVCLTLMALLLTAVVCFTSCGSGDGVTASTATYNEPVWHISVYSPEIESNSYVSWRRAKYTVETNDLSTVFCQPYCEYGMLTIQKSNGEIELVHVSLVEIEYY